MIQTQQFEGFPVFGDNSSKSQPEAAIYSNGFAPADVLPAEYYNWLTNKASVGITDLNRGLSSVEEELNNVVTAGGTEPTEETSNQVITTIKYLIAQAKKEAILDAHPVGSLYWSSKNTNPSQLFGGTWTQIKDKFILSAGDTYKNNDIGGNATVTLTVNQIPSHTHKGYVHSHDFTPSGTVSSHSHGVGTFKIASDGVHSHAYNLTENDTQGPVIGAQRLYYKTQMDGYTGEAGLHTHNITGSSESVAPDFIGIQDYTGAAGGGNTGYTGGGASHNNMPPYIVKYCWERTA